MGYARLSAGRTSVLIDAASPPSGAASANAHASTLAFELTSGRRPLVVNCGSGTSFGPEWRRAGRATPSHSTLCLDGYSSAQLTSTEEDEGREYLTDSPQHVPIEIATIADGMRFQGGHDGYLRSHGLTHARTLDLTRNGCGLAGEDMLLAMDEPAKRRFGKALDGTRLHGVPFSIRFHLHPDVDATVDLGGAVISMALNSGEIWVFRHDDRMSLALEDSVYLEKCRLKPRSSKQIVLAGRALDYATLIRWSLSKAQDTVLAIRDLAYDEPVGDNQK